MIRGIVWLVVGFGVGVLANPLAHAEENGDRAVEVANEKLGHRLDQSYYDAGTRVDEAALDLQQVQRQGEDVPEHLVAQLNVLSQQMRERWLELDAEREQIHRALRIAPADGRHVLRIDNLSTASSPTWKWFGIQQATIEAGDEMLVAIEASQFNNARFIQRYSHRVEPAPMAVVQAKPTDQSVVTAAFDEQPESDMPTRLRLTGLDDDKPGQVEIRITLNDVVVFEGENPFADAGWESHDFDIPAEAWSARVEIETAGDPDDAYAPLVERVEAFEQWSERASAELLDEAGTYREKVRWSKDGLKRENWLEGFIRGTYLRAEWEETNTTGRDEWFYWYFPYELKAMQTAGFTMLNANYYRGDVPMLTDAMAEVGMPTTVTFKGREHDWYDDPSLLDDLAMAEMEEVGGADHPTLVGLNIDEPRIYDAADEQPQQAESYARVREAFRVYVEARREALEAEGVAVPAEPEPVVYVESDSDRPMWMLWQQFKGYHLSEFWSGFRTRMNEQGVFVYPVVMNRYHDRPQWNSHARMARALPLISTDLYSNGTMTEAFVMSLMKQAASGRATLTTGAGYSARNEARFARSLAVGMTHADGVVQWQHAYASKYRNPLYFWRFMGRIDNHDDRGLNERTNWRPEYWPAQTRMLARMEQAEPWLAGATSAAPVGFVFSERTAIAETADSAQRAYYHHQQGLYSDLIRTGWPLDAVYAETLVHGIPERYGVLVIANAAVLDNDEVETLRAWVEAGGTLIVAGDTGFKNRWAQEVEEPELLQWMGLRVLGEKDGASNFTGIEDMTVAYASDLPYYDIEVADDVEVLGSFDNGDVALTHAERGNGAVYYIAAARPGVRRGNAADDSGLFHEGLENMGPMIRTLADRHLSAAPAIQVHGLPDGVEVQMRRVGDAWVLHLLDWIDNRTLEGLEVSHELEGRWQVAYAFASDDADDHASKRDLPANERMPLREAQLHEMVVFTPAE